MVVQKVLSAWLAFSSLQIPEKNSGIGLYMHVHAVTCWRRQQISPWSWGYRVVVSLLACVPSIQLGLSARAASTLQAGLSPQPPNLALGWLHFLEGFFRVLAHGRVTWLTFLTCSGHIAVVALIA